MRFSSPIHFPKSFHLSLRTRLSIGVVATVLATTFATATVALYLVQTHLRSSIANEEFARLSAIGDAIDQKFVSRRTLLSTFAKSIEIQDLGNTAKLQTFLDRHGSLNEAFDKVSLLDRSGNLVANLDGAKQNGRVNVSDRPYFIDTVRLRSGLISQPIRNRINGQPQVVMTEPIVDQRGEVVYVMSGAINLQERNFLGGLPDIRFGQTGYLFILNTDGIIISHPLTSRILLPSSAQGGRNIPTERALAGFEGTTEGANRAGVYGLYAFKRITQTNWIVGAMYPASEAFAVIDSLQQTAWAGALLLATLFGGLSLVVLRHYLAPLTRLQDHIRRAEDAASYTPASPSFARDEIGALALAFDGLMRDRQAAQDSLRASEKHFREVLTHAADAFISVDRHGAITEWNRQAEVTFGWKRPEAIGRSMVDLIQPGDYRQIDNPGIVSFAGTGLGAVVNARMEAIVRHRDGREIPVEMSVATVDMGDHYLADTFLRDITVRKQIERDLEKGARRLRTVTDSMPALISHLDRDFRYTYANANYGAWFSIARENMVGRTVAEVFGDTVFHELKVQMSRAMAGEDVTFERASTNPGSPGHMLYHYLPDRDADGNVVGIYGMVLDRTEQHNARIRVEASEKQLRAVTDNLPVLITYIADDERVRFMNATFHEWVGVDLAQALGKPLSEVLGPTLYGQRRDQLRRALAGERVEFEVESLAAGTRRSMNTIYTPDIRPDGSVAGVFTLSMDVTRLKIVEQELERLARHDSLTGLPNRRQFIERLELAVARCKRTKRPMAVIYMDIDHFKAINDHRGHAAGDAVLQAIAARLTQNVRETDTAARLSGDEFVVILEELNAAEEASAVAAKLGAALRVPISVADGELAVTCSMGVVYYVGEDATADEVLARADSALYLAKAAGRDTYRYVNA